MPKKNLRSEIEKAARERLGLELLRPGQTEAVESVLEGHDTLVVQPTGSGKSAIYQLAGLLIRGSTVIVSPLIALQKDQVQSIQDQDSAEAVAVNSNQRVSEIRERLNDVENGAIEYVFLAPEQLRKPEIVEKLKSAGVSLFVVDEAHCISEWGHDFRPDYLRLRHAIEVLGHPRVLALTATATPRVREEIVARLGMRDPKVFAGGFDRPNLYLRVDHFPSADEKREALVHRVRWADKPGIVYTGTRREAEEIVGALSEANVQAVFYHGGMKAADRNSVQERFMSGEAEVIVATNAFGMGIDKPDIRFVYHYDPSDSLEGYYQEIGRAGRDGEKAEAILFYRAQDIGAQSFKTGGGKIERRALEQLAGRIAEEEGPVDPAELGAKLGFSGRKLTAALQRLEDSGAAETLASGEVRAVEYADPAAAVREALQEEERRRAAKQERLEAMRAYAECTGCRREMLLSYFGDEYQGPCRFCDNCES
ncbi:MAG TPA: ATP-dependent DNA helicase RecQ, partial [Bryobacteraceae bacterium]|nr:ATP-dependent DNA helicase RecQ [Bryobacteraceae bacterium]